MGSSDDDTDNKGKNYVFMVEVEHGVLAFSGTKRWGLSISIWDKF